ncbi:uncharacterized protein LOC125371765 [Haliotis rufescens]|uniref:uncharacterized protein LOC125371765 n=1 Tax=Haliotis rufescens TaxID=6454 RepID=UPI00201F4662|nr:uncharacterized protein LOC125371765 [Haliotis rufescens]
MPIINSPSPRLSSFSGDGTKGEVKYKQWHLEIVGCRRENAFSDTSILNAMRRSAKGSAADLLSGLSETVTLDTAIEQLDLVFGNVMPGETLMERFYTARQEKNESVAVWSCRLRDLISKIEASGTLPHNAAPSLLRSRFWMGLTRDDLKQATRHHFDSGTDYNKLLLAVRRVEEELATPGDAQSCQLTTTTTSNRQLDDVLFRLKVIDKNLRSVGDRVNTLEYKSHRPSNTAQNQANKAQSQAQNLPPRSTTTNVVTQGSTSRTPYASQSQLASKTEVHCYDCGKIGVRRRHPQCPALNS